MTIISIKKENCFEGFHSRNVSIGEAEKEHGTTIQTSETVTVNENLENATNTPTIICKPTELNESTTA